MDIDEPSENGAATQAADVASEAAPESAATAAGDGAPAATEAVPDNQQPGQAQATGDNEEIAAAGTAAPQQQPQSGGEEDGERSTKLSSPPDDPADDSPTDEEGKATQVQNGFSVFALVRIASKLTMSVRAGVRRKRRRRAWRWSRAPALLLATALLGRTTSRGSRPSSRRLRRPTTNAPQLAPQEHSLCCTQLTLAKGACRPAAPTAGSDRATAPPPPPPHPPPPPAGTARYCVLIE